MRPSSTTAVSVCALACLALSDCRAWSRTTGVPPFELWWHEQQPRLVYESWTGEVAYSTREQRVSIDWSRTGGGAAPSQRFATDYWPTATAVLSDGRTLVVAGKREDGRTVVEAWVVEAPESEPGRWYGERASVAVIHDDAVEGRDMVARLFGNLGDEDAFFAQSWDSHEVWAFSAREGSEPRLLASPVREVDGLGPIPELANPFTLWWCATHRAKGHVYVLVDDYESELSLVLVDADRDGRLDGFRVVPHDDWGPEWGDAGNYEL